MTNFEHYKGFFVDLFQENGFLDIGLKKGIPKNCHSITCMKCDLYYMKGGCKSNIKKWLQEEYKEPEVDWTKVPVDTKILVRDFKTTQWVPRYFAKYDKNRNTVFAWNEGRTSWTSDGAVSWRFAKLAEEVI